MEAYWAGFLETNLTFDITYAHYANTIERLHRNKCRILEKYLSDNMNYMIMQSEMWGKIDPYWYQVGLQLWQIKGISDAFNKKFVKSSDQLTKEYLREMITDVMGIYLLQVLGDLEDLTRALSLDVFLKHFNKLGHPSISRASCSALVKLLPNDVFVSHVTWSHYNLMLRVIKQYHFPWKLIDSPNANQVPASTITFTSYPSVISSFDDFYITSQKLVVTETTNEVYNSELWYYVRNNSKNIVFTFMRAMVANRLAQSSWEWADIFRRKNSGTYNNQWMLIDTKQWSKNGQIRDNGALIIVEQIPGLVMVEDVTSILKNQSFWPSYNLPYFKPIYKLSGVESRAKLYGDWYIYDKTSRAKLFQRDHQKVKDLKSMYKLMRYNNFRNDTLSKCSCSPPFTALNAISARSDLDDPQGVYPIQAFGYRFYGGIDVKIANLSTVDQMNFIATSGPTYDNVPSFKWLTKNDSVKKPLMQPSSWEFTPIITKFKKHSLPNESFDVEFLSFDPFEFS